MRLRDSRVVRTAIALLGRWTSDELVDVSAGITYWTVLSIFPAVLAFTAMLGWLGFFIGEDNADDVRRHVIDFVEEHLGTSGGPVAKTVIDILSTPRGGVAAVGFLIAVWSMSKGFAGLFRGLARIYGHPGRRSNLLGRAIAIAFGLGTVLLVLVLLLSIVVGPLLGFEHLLPNDGGALITIWSYARWPFITGAVISWIAVLLSIGPGTGVRWRRALPGAAFAAVAWVVVTIGFGLYFRFTGGANPVYGVLGGIIVVLTWLHVLVIALLVGGMLNEMRWNAPVPRSCEDCGVSDVIDPDDDDEPVAVDDELTTLDRTRVEYTGVDLDDEFQPVDEVELAEEGLLLDDPVRLSEGRSALGGDDLDPDDVGWDLDADEPAGG